jgi:protein-S-isoprenylcysteine O-methyltransferase Ste14
VAPAGIPVWFVKAVKIGILVGIIIQTMVPDVLPIATDATLLRVFGTCVYTAGLLMAVVGRWQLGRNWSDIEDARVHERQVLVSMGIYRYVRHPIYAGDLLLLFGLQLALNSWLVVAVVVLAPIVVRQALREEAALAGRLAGYRSYASATKRFVPFVV